MPIVGRKEGERTCWYCRRVKPGSRETVGYCRLHKEWVCHTCYTDGTYYNKTGRRPRGYKW